MRRTETAILPCARLLSIAATAAAISACGGGSGGGGLPVLPIAPAPAPAELPAPPAVESSAPCFNEADFREGTTVEFEAVKAGASSTALPFRRKSVTEGREPFAGAKPVAFNVGSEALNLPQFEQSTVKKEYKDFVSGSILLYGKATTQKTKVTPPQPATPPSERVFYSSQAYAPPFSFPVDMKPGQVVKQQISFTKTETIDGRIDSTSSAPATGELIYYGREKLETPLGTFNTCKFSLKITVGSAPLAKVTVSELWQASEGPYRGQVLKGIDPKSPMIATKMTYSPK
ncbi:hypothetical protein NWF24_26545 [Variovorax paradoxus]|uniref:hypothetical protein n=1 Tax=Variovorax paradoxus TaxID=34073 RepID=UPI0021AC1BE2|nr:hypothetical protein [Variovorax paradoxus]UVH56374.1 hypothetical protein NWF24_26545 [Variovorax paradoxus]